MERCRCLMLLEWAESALGRTLGSAAAGLEAASVGWIAAAC